MYHGRYLCSRETVPLSCKVRYISGARKTYSTGTVSTLRYVPEPGSQNYTVGTRYIPTVPYGTYLPTDLTQQCDLYDEGSLGKVDTADDSFFIDSAPLPHLIHVLVQDVNQRHLKIMEEN